MTVPFVVHVAIRVEAEDADDARTKVYDDLWPLYGDKSLLIGKCEEL